MSILLTCLTEVCLSGVVEVVVSSGTEGGTTGVNPDCAAAVDSEVARDRGEADS